MRYIRRTHVNLIFNSTKNQNREKNVVHSAANENRKVLESRKNGYLNVKIGLLLVSG